MNNSPPEIIPTKPRLWLGITVGWLAQLGLTSFLPIVVLTAIRLWSLQAENPSLWLEDPNDSSHAGWYVLQLTVFLGSLLAGALAATLSQGKYPLLAIGLIVLSLITTFFEQFPSPISASPLSTIVLLIWAGGPCLGAVIGVFTIRFFHKWRE